MTETTPQPGRSLPRSLPPGLLALTPGTLQRSRAGATDAVIAIMERAVRAAIAGGVRSVMVREPALEDGAFLELALRIRAALDDSTGDTGRGGWLSIHDRLHLAKAAGADAVHLGGTSLAIEPARRVVGEVITLGASSHASNEPGDFTGVDYLLHAPVFKPSSKPLVGQETLGWDGVEAFAAAASVPVLGLGGITIATLEEMLARDRTEDHDMPDLRRLYGVALIGGLWGSDSSPIDGMSRVLTDLGAIRARASELTRLSEQCFSGPGTRPDVHMGGPRG